MLRYTNDVTETPHDEKVEGSRSKLDRVLLGNGKYRKKFAHVPKCAIGRGEYRKSSSLKSAIFAQT
jgi:hypothetical protein